MNAAPNLKAFGQTTKPNKSSSNVITCSTIDPFRATNSPRLKLARLHGGIFSFETLLPTYNLEGMPRSPAAGGSPAGNV